MQFMVSVSNFKVQALIRNKVGDSQQNSLQRIFHAIEVSSEEFSIVRHVE
jgi:hypothetical protein